jgi:IS5 family transposase
MLPATLDEIRVTGASERPRQRPDRLLADKGYPSKTNRAWLRERGVAATIPERDNQIAHLRERPGGRSTSVTSSVSATGAATS